MYIVYTCRNRRLLSTRTFEMQEVRTRGDSSGQLRMLDDLIHILMWPIVAAIKLLLILFLVGVWILCMHYPVFILVLLPCMLFWTFDDC